ncbi:lysophospholipid acyltransferase family protein [Candidatus Phytoplasma oryzae]|nr:lysophospholipid acyltransferase family protein [Candidatus Phytoplasma oryzae]
MKKLEPNHPFKKKVLSSISELIIKFFRIQIKVYNKHYIPDKGQLVIYSNHKSFFDPFILAYFFPRTITFSPKNSLYNGFLGIFLGFCFNSLDCMQIVRGDNRETFINIMKTIDKIKKNFLSIVIFHEGGRKNKKNDKIIDSLEGSFKIALKSESAILPVSIKGSSDMIGKCWFRKKKIEVFVHPCIDFEDYKEQKTQKINERVNKIINSVL